MAIDYSLKIRDGVVDDRVRDLLIEAYPEQRITQPASEALTFDLNSDLLHICAFYSPDRLRNIGGHPIQTNAVVWFRHSKHDLHSAALQMLRCVLHLISHMSNDMVLLWQGEEAILAQIGGELLLPRDDDGYWQTPGYKDLLRGRRYRVVPMKV